MIHLGGRLSRLLRPTRCAVPSSKFLFSYGATPLHNLLIEPTRHGISRYARELRVSILSDAAFSFSIIDPFSLIAHDALHITLRILHIKLPPHAATHQVPRPPSQANDLSSCVSSAPVARRSQHSRPRPLHLSLSYLHPGCTGAGGGCDCLAMRTDLAMREMYAGAS